jgi:hypothetical protein
MPVTPFKKPGTPAAPAKAVGGFKRPVPAAAKTVAKPKTKYAGIECRPPKDPMPEVGTYRFELVQCTEGFNPGKRTGSYKMTCRVVDTLEGGPDSNKPGDQVFLTFSTSTGPGLQDAKSAVVGFSGFELPEDYDAYDPGGVFMSEAAGCLDFGDKYTAANGGEQPLIGRLCDVRVRRGNTTADGTDWYRKYDWYALAEEDQAVAMPVLE